MIIVDTNVISEPLRPKPHARVVEWIDAQHSSTLFLTAITVAELRTGIALLPDGRRKDALREGVEERLLPRFHGRILPFDDRASVEFARLQTVARALGRGLPSFDGLIAAIANSHAFALATRNITDFSELGIKLIDPWQHR